LNLKSPPAGAGGRRYNQFCIPPSGRGRSTIEQKIIRKNKLTTKKNKKKPLPLKSGFFKKANYVKILLG
jgi:hypothetical protein